MFKSIQVVHMTLKKDTQGMKKELKLIRKNKTNLNLFSTHMTM